MSKYKTKTIVKVAIHTILLYMHYRRSNFRVDFYLIMDLISFNQ